MAVDTALVVSATVLGVKPFQFHTQVHELPAGPLAFLSPHQVVVQAPVKLKTEDRLWLGHVIECRAEGDSWRVTMQVEHVLRDLPELLRLASRFA